MRAVVDEDQVGGEEEDGDHVADHDLATTYSQRMKFCARVQVLFLEGRIFDA